MIVKRYGSSITSVEPHFDARAMTEIGFHRTSALQMPAEDFFASYDRVGDHIVEARSEGGVQIDAELALLKSIQEQVAALEASLQDGEVLLFENEQGKDYPRVHEKQEAIIADNQNKLFFHRHLDPPVKLARYRRNKAPGA